MKLDINSIIFSLNNSEFWLCPCQDRYGVIVSLYFIAASNFISQFCHQRQLHSRTVTNSILTTEKRSMSTPTTSPTISFKQTRHVPMQICIENHILFHKIWNVIWISNVFHKSTANNTKYVAFSTHIKQIMIVLIDLWRTPVWIIIISVTMRW